MNPAAIMYHDVVDLAAVDSSGFPGPDAALYKIAPAVFEAHLHALNEVTTKASRVIDVIDGAADPSPFFITFDDGGASAYNCIAGMLERFGWRGHFFVPTAYIGTERFLSTAQIRELHERGHVIGSHSSTHPVRMSHCAPDEMLREWTASVEILSNILGVRVTVASVPGGHYSRGVAVAAATAGIRALFTSEPTTRCDVVGKCLVLGRYTVQNWMSTRTVAGLVAGHAGPRLRQVVAWKAKKASKALAGRGYLRLRKALIVALTRRGPQTR